MRFQFYARRGFKVSTKKQLSKEINPASATNETFMGYLCNVCYQQKSLSHKIGCGFRSYGYKDCCKGLELLSLTKTDRHVKRTKDYLGFKSS